MRTIAVINQKGGCGKTTVAIHLSGALSRAGRRVLLIDLDPQAHASLGLGRVEEEPPTTYEILRYPDVSISDVLTEVRPGLWLVPGSTVVSGIEQELAGQDGREDRLRGKLARLAPDSFDFVVIDCPPGVGLLTFNALVAADEVLIPIDASVFAMHGLARLRETIGVLESELGHVLRTHVVCNNVDTRTHFSNEMLDEMKKLHDGVLSAFISNSVRLKEAAALGVTIFDLDVNSKPALQFAALARELAHRMSHTERRRAGSARAEKSTGPERAGDAVRFMLVAPNATSVRLLGEFPGFPDDGVPLTRDDDDGVWKVELEVAPGEYAYHFVVDGNAMRDPGNREYARNEFGREDSVLTV